MGADAGLLLELAGRTGVHGVMPTVVRSWRHLVGKQAKVLNPEKLKRKHTHVPKLECKRLHMLFSLLNNILRQSDRNVTGMKNAVTMLVLRSRKDSHMTLRITGDNNRNLGLE